MEERRPQWRGIRARYAAMAFSSKARVRMDRDVIDGIRRSVNEDDTVVDLGAGTGFFSLAVAPLLRGGKVIALDISPEMLADLTRRARNADLADRIEPLVADATRSGIPDQSVDVIVCGNLLHELPDPEAVVGEMARMLRPAGRVLIRDFRDGLLGRLMKVMHRHDAHGPLDEEEITEILQAAGFSDVEVTTSTSRYLVTARKNGARAA